MKVVFVKLLYFVVIFCVGNVYLQSETLQSDTVIRQTKYGPVVGTVTELAQKFLGVPFAAPAKRFVHFGYQFLAHLSRRLTR